MASGETQVSIVKCENYDDVEGAIRRSLDLIGGIKKVVNRGDVVLIKPNLVTAVPSDIGATTHPAVVAALVKLVKEAGASRVIVGENPGITITSREAFEKTGVGEAALKAGAEISYFDEEPHVWVEIPGGVVFKKVRLPKPVVECDVLISAPKMKMHPMTAVTLAIKNLQGLLLDEDKRKAHRSDLPQKLVDLYKAVKPKLKLAVVDGVVVLELENLIGLKANMGLIVSGTDLVALDSVAAACMGVEPHEVPTSQIGALQGLGIADLSMISIKGEEIEKVKKPLLRSSISYASIFPNVSVCLGGACLQGCLGWYSVIAIKAVLENPDKRYAFIVGREAVVPEPLEADEIWVYGDCAVDSLSKAKTLKGAVKIVRGCPPLPEDLFKEVVGTLSSHIKEIRALVASMFPGHGE